MIAAALPPKLPASELPVQRQTASR